LTGVVGVDRHHAAQAGYHGQDDCQSEEDEAGGEQFGDLAAVIPVNPLSSSSGDYRFGVVSQRSAPMLVTTE